MAMESNAAKVRRYKANLMVMQGTLEHIQTKQRDIDSKLLKLEMRDLQLMQLLKMILEKATKGRFAGKLTMQKIIDWMDTTIRDYREDESKLTNMLDEIEMNSEEPTEFGIDPEV